MRRNAEGEVFEYGVSLAIACARRTCGNWKKIAELIGMRWDQPSVLRIWSERVPLCAADSADRGHRVQLLPPAKSLFDASVSNPGPTLRAVADGDGYPNPDLNSEYVVLRSGKRGILA